jgi:hypothetical protein
MAHISHLRQIGTLGTVLMGLLVFLVAFRWIWVAQRSRNMQFLGNMTTLKKHSLYAMLLMTPLLDVPMYVSFMISGRYYLVPYSFHKLAPAARLAAFSITISNWRTVLFELHDYSYYPSLLGTAYLLSINVIVDVFAFINFGLCFSVNNFKSFLDTQAYVILCFIMIIFPFLLAVIMLRAGLALSSELQAAAGGPEFELIQEVSCDDRKSFQTSNFKFAVQRLNRVMATCALAILIQVSRK